MNEAMRDWVASVDDTHYLIGTVAGPHPFPLLVREFQRIISTEARAQVLDRYGRLPGRRRRLRGRRLERAGHLRRLHPRRRGRPARLRGRGRRGVDRSARRDHLRRLGRGAARHAHLRPAGRGRPDQGLALHLGRPGLPGRRPRALLARGDGPGDVRARHRHRGDGGLPPAHPDRGHPARPSSRRTAWPARCGWGARCRRGPTASRRSSWSTSPAAGTRTSTPPSSGSTSTPGAPARSPAARWAPTSARTRSSTCPWTRADRPAPPRSSCDRGRRRRPFDRGRTGDVFAATREQGRGALVGFLHVGYPDVPTSLAALRALTGEGESRGRRPRRGRAALQRPDDGRRHDPARRHPGAAPRRPDARRVRPPSRRSPPPARRPSS